MARQISDPVAFRSSTAGAWLQKDWLDGTPWLIEGGVDFASKASTARLQLLSFASENGFSAHTKVDGENILFQAYVPTDEEKARKALSAEKRAATRAANTASGVKPAKASKRAPAPEV